LILSRLEGNWTKVQKMEYKVFKLDYSLDEKFREA